jgi:prolyl-tRNA synthetase
MRKAMKASTYFFPLLKETPSEASIVSHRLMLRAGMICQESAGIYSWLPLGLKVLKKIEQIVREEQNRIGCHEILMPTIQGAELWQESGRFQAYGEEMLRLKDRHERDLIYGPTNEEMVTHIFRRFVKSYRQLPQCLYQIQWKFRDEIRPRFGVMRGREFLMKDAYSFDLTKEEAVQTYYKMMQAYLRTFSRMGLKVLPVRADTGPIGGELSHEFHVLAETGESTIYYEKAFESVRLDQDINVEEILALYAMADEMHVPEKCSIPSQNLKQAKGIEVGHIFNFGTKYTQSMNATVVGPKGESIAPEMGSYGIGIGRLVAAIIEASHDDKGIIWPKTVAPFHVGLLNLKVGDSLTDSLCEDVLGKLDAMGLEVFYEDRNESPGAKFATVDLIGLPWQVILGPRGAQNGLFELKTRATGERQELSQDQLLNFFAEIRATL